MAGSILPRVIAPAIAAIVLGLLALLFRRARPASGDVYAGTISPEKISAGIAVVVGMFMAIAGLAVAISGHGTWVGVVLALMGMAIGGFMAPSLTSMHNVHWTADGIEGPAKLFGLTLGRARTTILWTDVVRTGTTITGYWYVESSDGRRVYWSYLYKGYGSLTALLRVRCPSLNLPARMR